MTDEQTQAVKQALALLLPVHESLKARSPKIEFEGKFGFDLRLHRETSALETAIGCLNAVVSK